MGTKTIVEFRCVPCQWIYDWRDRNMKISGTDLHDLFRALTPDDDPSPSGAVSVLLMDIVYLSRDHPVPYVREAAKRAAVAMLDQVYWSASNPAGGVTWSPGDHVVFKVTSRPVRWQDGEILWRNAEIPGFYAVRVGGNAANTLQLHYSVLRSRQ